MVECGGLWRPDRFAPSRYEGELFCDTNYRMSELEAAVDVIQLGKMRETTGRFRSVKRNILDRLGHFREIQPQILNDPDGEVGYMLRFYPESTDLGERIVAALQAEGVPSNTRGSKGRPDWHIYHSMFAVVEQRGATSDGCPFTCPIYTDRGGVPRYAKGDCPVADDLFDRMISIPLNQWYTETDCGRIVEGINKVLKAYCTEDASAAVWR
jgi:dTDP-4-amino-4,6-dideoxygalactose transaminase